MTELSIIIPHFNSSKLLEKLIESIPKMPEIQIIIVDDHSNTQNKNDLIVIEEKYKDANILFLSNHPDKKSAGACRNIGLKHAVGEWVLFADADDFFLEDFWGIVEMYLDSQVEVIFFKPTSIEIDTGQLSDRHFNLQQLIEDYLNKTDSMSENRLRYFFDSPISKVIKLEFLKKNKIEFDEVIASNDVMFSTKVGYYMKKFIVSKKVIYCITKSKGSLTTTINEQIFDTRVNVFINQYKFLKEKCLTPEKFKKIKNKISGRSLLVRSLDLGLSKSLSVYWIFRKNKIHILDKSVFNPITTFKKINTFHNKKINNKRFYHKTNL